MTYPQPSPPLVLASSSEIRATLLRNAGVTLQVDPADLNESAIRDATKEAPADIAATLAAAKAAHVAQRHPSALTLGADQILEFEGRPVAKAATIEEAKTQLAMLSGGTHILHSAAAICEGGAPVWQHTSSARLHMRPLTGPFIDAYLTRNWQSVRFCVGCYKIEEEGPRLFERIEGSHFAILGLPLLEVLSYLTNRGRLTT